MSRGAGIDGQCQSDGSVKILDLGLAKLNTGPGVLGHDRRLVIGTIAYMSPEPYTRALSVLI